MFRSMKLVLIVFLSGSLYAENNINRHQNFIQINKKMIENKVFYSRYQGNSFYLQSKFKKMNPSESFGEVSYTMMNSAKSMSGNMEYVSYSIKNGKIVIYGNDGSASRLTLISTRSNRWIFIQEEDMDGNGKQFGFKKLGEETWYLKKPKGYPALEKCKPVDFECFVRAF